ncbi:hypothetical protein QYE76_051742 [Lolium multiflorum]|uniref:Uncharacterized protein n=1 Tax=Lolium multiflorum TaxID=4521 RepID=A0AAD8SSF1_LOLMU|nr:hypothetical protein QYE76_051742 [Lolium multiflorum]
MDDSAASPSRVILGLIPRVSAADDKLPPGADLSLALQAPPLVVLLTIPPRIFPRRTTFNDFPSVLAIGTSGLLLLLLLKVDQGPATGHTIIGCWRRDTNEKEIAKFKLQMKELFKMSYLAFLIYYLGIKVQEKLGHSCEAEI